MHISLPTLPTFIAALASLFFNRSGYAQMELQNQQKVHRDTIIIFSGQTLYFHVDIKNDSIVTFHKERKMTDSSRTLIICFDLKSKDIEEAPSMLTVFNPFGKKLFYKCKIQEMKTDAGFIETAVLPIPQKKSFYAMWPNKVRAIKIYDLKLK